jgi:inosine/xanthosine triphosphatase
MKFLVAGILLLSVSFAGEEMTLAIGSTNQNKIGALEEVIQEYPDFAGSTVIACQVSSGVSDQPLSLEETIRGAKNRAKNAFMVSGACKYAFGVESGLFEAPGTQSGYLEACICAIYNGVDYSIGLSCGFEVPRQALRLVLQQKMDLNQACHNSGISSDPKLGSSEGLVGMLTKGRINRKKYTKLSIMTALIQLENSHLYAGE